MSTNLLPFVLFNASVILAGLKSPNGGSGCLLNLVKKREMVGVISETILDEVLRHSERVEKQPDQIQNIVIGIFKVHEAPHGNLIEYYKKIVFDYGDAHVLASARETKVDYLVTLDKKHLLAIKDNIREFKIVSPGELLSFIRKRE